MKRRDFLYLTKNINFLKFNCSVFLLFSDYRPNSFHPMAWELEMAANGQPSPIAIILPDFSALAHGGFAAGKGGLWYLES